MPRNTRHWCSLAWEVSEWRKPCLSPVGPRSSNSIVTNVKAVHRDWVPKLHIPLLSLTNTGSNHTWSTWVPLSQELTFHSPRRRTGLVSDVPATAGAAARTRTPAELRRGTAGHQSSLDQPPLILQIPLPAMVVTHCRGGAMSGLRTAVDLCTHSDFECFCT